MRKRAQRRARRDPEQTLQRILWLAEQAEHDEGAREVLHDALLNAHDVPSARPSLISIIGERSRTLAEKYSFYIEYAEREAEASDSKWSVTLTPSDLKYRPESALTVRPAGPAKWRGILRVYTTRAGL